ncbi:DVU_1556 family methyltransferase [Sulfurospirillum arcachonense]|uniref:DVU_1556 family methyltransferase n=1 Tax=Sulfurospirillum arcachonense TaxID=57666 RepID=UPI0004B94D98|nr:class I SAM-dependent methyltransferase [Sulfurospirillum arcachonense]
MNAYESCCMQEVTGETLRPGGFELTKKAVRFCSLDKEDNVLDLGCGRGATIEYLWREHLIRATGVDLSQKLLKIAKEKNPLSKFVFAKGDSLPFDNNSFECVFAECTLSLMDHLQETLKEAHRVLSNDGWFVITDVYAKNPEAIDELTNFSITSCVRGLHQLPLLEEKLEKMGFEIILVEDHSHFLKELMVKIIFSHGSMSAFWSKTMSGEKTQTCCSFEKTLQQCKPGYFMILARKKGGKNG